MSSRLSIAAGIVLFLAAGSAWADEPTAPAPAAATEPQWQKDQDLDKAVWADVQSGGLRAVAPHVADMEQALANAKQTMASAIETDGSHIVFTDGDAETMIALGAIVPDKSGPSGRIEAQENRYLGMGLLLGSYYNDVGKYDDALRVLTLALTLDAVQTGGLGMGGHVPYLVSEKGAALNGLKRWSESLATYDAGLAIKDMEPTQRALLYRGRGFALTESGRLDEAEASYWASLKLEPGNTTAINELTYIGRLRSGKPATQGGLFLSHPPGPATPPAAPATSPPASTPTPAPSPTPN